MPDPDPLSIETIVVSAGRPAPGPDQPLNTPIVPASAFHAGGSIEYAREAAPTTSALEEALGALEHGTAIAFSSGMAAANAVLDLVPSGAVVVAPSAAYTGVAVRLRELDAIGRISLRIVDADDTDGVIAACAGAHLLWLESPTNPILQVADLPACISAAHAAGAEVLVDNTFATPVLQTPLELGADLVLHSVTKSLSGHSDLLMGAIVARDPCAPRPSASGGCCWARRPARSTATWPCAASGRWRSGWRGPSRTRPRSRADWRAIRSSRGCATPASAPSSRSRWTGGAAVADALCGSVRVWTYATSLGGVESLLERRRRWPLESATVPEGLVRLSVGIEAVEDLWTDLDRALRMAPDQARAQPPSPSPTASGA